MEARNIYITTNKLLNIFLNRKYGYNGKFRIASNHFIYNRTNPSRPYYQQFEIIYVKLKHPISKEELEILQKKCFDLLNEILDCVEYSENITLFDVKLIFCD